LGGNYQNTNRTFKSTVAQPAARQISATLGFQKGWQAGFSKRTLKSMLVFFASRQEESWLGDIRPLGGTTPLGYAGNMEQRRPWSARKRAFPILEQRASDSPSRRFLRSP